MSLAGTYETTVKSPMGEQKGNLSVEGCEGGTWTGKMTGSLGSMDVQDGTCEGNTLKWKMDMTVPMPMTLNCTATVDDAGALTGTVNAGAFGDMPLSGQKQA